MLRKIFISAIALSLAAGTAAFAQSEGGTPEYTERRPMGMFDRLDVDGNGSIAADEFGGERLEMLRATDADGDGTLSEDELLTYVMERAFKRRAERAARYLDIDGDGTVTLAEIEDHQNKRFALFDRNNDGEVSREELQRSGFARRMMHFHGARGEGPRAAFRAHHRNGRHHVRDAAPAGEAPAEE